jgi:hypothetical protein
MLRSLWNLLRTHRVFNLILATILIALVFLFRSSRGVREPADRASIPIRVATRSGDLELSLYLPRSNFPLTSAVPVTLSVKNVGSQMAALFFSSGKKFDFAVLNSASKEIWRWSRGRVFTMAIEEIMLEKDQEISFKAAWPQVDFEDKPVPPGTYLIRGESAASQVKEKVEARIVVESSTERPSESR